MKRSKKRPKKSVARKTSPGVRRGGVWLAEGQTELFDVLVGGDAELAA